MKKILDVLDRRFEEVVGIVSLAVTVTLIFIGVVMRVGLKSGLAWQEEISRILYVFVVYIGASYGIKSGDHIRVTFVAHMMPEKWRKVLDFATDLIWIGFNIAIIILSFGIYHRMQKFLGETAVLYIPLHYIFLIIPVGFILLTFRLIQARVRR
jgi:TRAP-type C4-dicarboxylate transport system permease small subunit